MMQVYVVQEEILTDVYSLYYQLCTSLNFLEVTRAALSFLLEILARHVTTRQVLRSSARLVSQSLLTTHSTLTTHTL